MRNRKLWIAILAGAMAAIMLFGLIFGLLASAVSAASLSAQPVQAGQVPEITVQAGAAIDGGTLESPWVCL